jgi:multidrug efflux system outer membrane protein
MRRAVTTAFLAMLAVGCMLAAAGWTVHAQDAWTQPSGHAGSGEPIASSRDATPSPQASVGPSSPAVMVPARFRGDDAVPRVSVPTGTPEPSIGDLGWWQIFGDPVLQNLIHTALTRNFDLRVAMLRVETARANVGVARSEQLPQFNASAGLVVNEQSTHNPDFFPGLLPRTTTFGQVLLNLLSFELDIWGRLRHQTRAARAELRASEEDRKAVMTTVVSDVASAYFNLLALDAQLEVDRETLATRQRSLELIRARYEGGLATLLDVRQAEQLVQGAQVLVPDAERQIAQTENALNLLLGNEPGPVQRGASLTKQQQLPAVPPGLPSRLLLRRPDIRAAEQRLASQHEQVYVARAAFLPQISLSGLFGFQSVALNNLISPASRTSQMLPLVTQPVYTGGRLTSQLALARGNEAIALVQYQQTIATALRDVSDALVQYQKVHETRAMLEGLVETLRDRSRLAYLRYNGGVDTLLNALDADRDLFNAQLQLAQSRRDELLSIVQLYKALGGGWQLAP